MDEAVMGDRTLRSRIYAGVFVLVTAFAGLSTSAVAASFPPLFNSIDYRNESLDALPQWQRVVAEIERESAIYEVCIQGSGSCESQALLAWQAMIKSQSGPPDVEQLHAVNRFINGWTPRTDQANHRREDYWASPLTFLSRSGDCEDYAIIKYVSLRQLGYDPEQLRLVVVRDVLRDMAHAVLAVHLDDEIHILDNLFNAVLPQHMVSQYVPYYSVNESARFSHLPSDSVLLASAPWDIVPSMITKSGTH
jgi:predicted transglutaminase-like cysteine proteinase